MNELLSLNGGNLPGAKATDKHRLVQEFFFHLVGAVDWAAQVVNERCELHLDPDQVTVPVVCDHLPLDHPIRPRLASLYARTKGKPLPADPYSREGLVFRAYNYRHQVTHRSTNPFRYGDNPETAFSLDPREDSTVRSQLSVEDDMEQMFAIFKAGCQDVFASLP
jgi:hypothetical protein